jgi:hypothetical protein
MPHASWPFLALLLVSLWPPRFAAAPAGGAAPSVAVAGSPSQAEPGCGPGQPDDPGTAWGLIGHMTTDYPTSAPGRNFNMALASRRLCGTLIPPGGVFSFNGQLGESGKVQGYKVGRVFIGDRIVPGYGGGVCQVATTIYEAALRAGLDIVERHQHGLTVPYLLPGEDATISYGALDLRLRNDTGGPLRLVTRATGGRVTAEFYGTRQPPEVRWIHKELRRFPFYTIRNSDPELPKGKEEVDAPGQEGVVVHSWLEREWPDGRVERFDMGVDSYRASPRIVRVGTGRAANRSAAIAD